MKKAAEYRKHAADCRKLAAGMDGQQRDQLLRMADTWDGLAHERETFALAVEERVSFSEH